MVRVRSFLAVLGALLVIASSVAAAPEQVTIGFTVWNLQVLFFNQQLDGIRQAAEENNVEVVAIDCHNDLTRQVSSIEDLVQQGVDAIIVNPVDAFGVIPAIEDAVAAAHGRKGQDWSRGCS